MAGSPEDEKTITPFTDPILAARLEAIKQLSNGLSDRVAVMHEGRITGVLDREDCNEQNVMQLAVGRPLPVSKPAFIS